MNKSLAAAVSTVTLTVTALVTLTACGGSDDSASDKIIDTPSSQSAPSPTASATASPVTSATAEPMDFHLPSDIKVVIDADATGDAAKDAVLHGQADTLTARQKLYVDLDPASNVLKAYFSGQARSFYAEQIAKRKKEGRTVTGTYRYYDRKVTAVTADTAVVTYCEDQSKAYSKDIKTGEVLRTAPTADDYRLYTATLLRNAAGVWQLDSFQGKAAAPACQ
ncbi:hypothetical protein ABZX65_13105 [Streptomyces sp. NPDC003300]|uniref:hypothetical protein n=1 Tax=unclassified Streptomyces TaxID=2593676 RepID=UPI0033ACBBE6